MRPPPGSQLALCYAARNPERVAGLVLLDTVGLAAPDWSSRRRERLGDEAMRRILELQDRFDAGSDPEADRELTHLTMRAGFVRPEMAAGFADELAASGLEIDSRISQALLRQRSRWLRRPDIREVVRALDVPTLVVHGEADLRPREHAEDSSASSAVAGCCSCQTRATSPSSSGPTSCGPRCVSGWSSWSEAAPNCLTDPYDRLLPVQELPLMDGAAGGRRLRQGWASLAMLDAIAFAEELGLTGDDEAGRLQSSLHARGGGDAQRRVRHTRMIGRR
jgi:hypothetical protein